MTTISDKDLPVALRRIKEKNENIYWTGRPRYFPFIAGRLCLVLCMIPIWIINLSHPGGVDEEQLWGIMLCTAFLLILLFLKGYSYSDICYAWSDKRVIMRTSFLTADFQNINLDKIVSIEVTANVFENLCNVGTLKFFSGETISAEGTTEKLYDKWRAIDNPYEVMNAILEAKRTLLDTLN